MKIDIIFDNKPKGRIFEEFKNHKAIFVKRFGKA